MTIQARITAAFQEIGANFNAVYDALALKADKTSLPKVYVASLLQDGEDAPAATVGVNTIGAIVWTRVGAGAYRGTLAGAFTTDGKTNVQISNAAFSLGNPVYITYEIAADYIYVKSSDFEGSGADALLGTIFTNIIEITVYP